MHDAGADHVLVLRTTQELLHLTAKEFFDAVLRQRLAVRALVEGVRLSASAATAKGNIDTLAELCRDGRTCR